MIEIPVRSDGSSATGAVIPEIGALFYCLSLSREINWEKMQVFGSNRVVVPTSKTVKDTGADKLG